MLNCLIEKSRSFFANVEMRPALNQEVNFDKKNSKRHTRQRDCYDSYETAILTKMTLWTVSNEAASKTFQATSAKHRLLTLKAS